MAATIMGPFDFFIRCLAVLLAGSAAFGEDFKLSDGTVLHRVRVVEVRPDALVVAHDKGVAMADLAKLPRAIRERYAYDAGKAAGFREREERTRKAVAEENRRLITAHEERRFALARAQWEAASTAESFVAVDGEIRFSPRESSANRALMAEVGGQVTRAEEARIAANAPVTFWTAPFWNVLKVLTGGGGAGARDAGSTSEPRNWR
jgi:hypothetical protein